MLYSCGFGLRPSIARVTSEKFRASGLRLAHDVTVVGRSPHTVLGDGTGADMSEFRVEHDSMGEVRVPADALWGAQTQRAVENFPISGRPFDPRVIRALALIKGEAAGVNAGSSGVPPVARRVADAIVAVADEIAAGGYPDQFP